MIPPRTQLKETDELIFIFKCCGNIIVMHILYNNINVNMFNGFTLSTRLF